MPKKPQKSQDDDQKKAVQAAQIDLIKEIGIDELDPKDQKKIILEINDLIQRRVLIRIAEDLDDKTREKLEELVGDKNTTPEQLEEFLGKEAPNFREMVLEEIGKHKLELVELVQRLKKGVAEE